MLGRTAYAAGRTVKWLVVAGSAILVTLMLAPDPPLAIGGLLVGGLSPLSGTRGLP
jgi:hypothetical protein